MPSARTAVATLAIAFLLTVSGCAALQGGSPDGDSIAADAATAIESVDDYTYNSTVTLRQNGTYSTIAVAGVVDRADRRLRFHQSVNGQSATQYVVGTTVYQNSSGSWRSSPLGNDSFWSDQLPLAGQRSILEDADATLVNETTVGGTAVYELQVNVTDAQLLEYLRQRVGAVSSQVSFSNVSYTAYVARDDHHLVRVTTESTVSFGDQRVDVSTTMDVGGYDENVTVDLPAAIEESR